jgi:hypothetical protein
MSKFELDTEAIDLDPSRSRFSYFDVLSTSPSFHFVKEVSGSGNSRLEIVQI